MDAEELAIKLYQAEPLWDHGVDGLGNYSRWPIAWHDLTDYGEEGDAKVVARRHAKAALAALETPLTGKA